VGGPKLRSLSSSPLNGGAWVPVRSFTSAVVTAQIASAALTSTEWRRIAV
jgi:hypothetical protein